MSSVPAKDSVAAGSLKISLIVPVHDRPREVERLLDSLVKQSDADFETVIVEDGSSKPCRSVVSIFEDRLSLRYVKNDIALGPGLARNKGVTIASGNFFVFVDSDCFLPKQYMETLKNELANRPIVAFGGPDTSHASFNLLQQAIDYSMTAFLTTGGIRGGRERLDLFYPKGFNMGMTKKVLDHLGGFADLRYGEDTEFSYRIRKAKYKVGFLANVFVHHERRSSLLGFARQVFQSGKARIIIFQKHRNAMKTVHLVPAVFVAVSGLSIIFSFRNPLFLLPLLIYLAVIGIHASIKLRNPISGTLAIITSLVQILSYGAGFIYQAFLSMIGKR